MRGCTWGEQRWQCRGVNKYDDWCRRGGTLRLPCLPTWSVLLLAAALAVRHLACNHTPRPLQQLQHARRLRCLALEQLRGGNDGGGS